MSKSPVQLLEEQLAIVIKDKGEIENCRAASQRSADVYEQTLQLYAEDEAALLQAIDALKAIQP